MPDVPDAPPGAHATALWRGPSEFVSLRMLLSGPCRIFHEDCGDGDATAHLPAAELAASLMLRRAGVRTQLSRVCARSALPISQHALSGVSPRARGPPGSGDPASQAEERT